jgi:hypothetical protein
MPGCPCYPGCPYASLEAHRASHAQSNLKQAQFGIIAREWKGSFLKGFYQGKASGFVVSRLTSEDQKLICDEWQRRYGNSIIDVIPPRPPRPNINKLRKTVEALLGLVRRPRHKREKPAPGTERAPRKQAERNGEHSKALVLQAVVKQEGRCIYCHHKFMTVVQENEFGTYEQLRFEEEHLQPRSADGKTVDGNIYAACQICNGVKSTYIFTGLNDERLIDLIRREWNHFHVVEGEFCPTCKRAY